MGALSQVLAAMSCSTLKGHQTVAARTLQEVPKGLSAGGGLGFLLQYSIERLHLTLDVLGLLGL